ncbi:DgyrCDS11595 [Dimorphilus gyrociliatus]|uniref:DgyrCDS11595 n=1 Tax=Dimorphilus gyrociliatus TaxID=2664684 RepID=A0A7I8W563_9ANNE|nr:DgyrCDS11595 [Dimorphilus gyrociliatus]
MSDYHPHIRIPVRKPLAVIPRRVPHLPVRFSARQTPVYSNGTTMSLKRPPSRPKVEEEKVEVKILSKEATENRKKEKRRKKVRMIKTITMILAWICMGLFSEICAPALPYLRARVKANYEEISRVLVARGLGFLIGALTGGIVCEAFAKYTDLVLAIALGVAGIGTAMAPLCTNLPMLGAMFSLDGCGKGVLASGGNGFIIRLWKDRAATPTYSLHFAFGVGALIAPQLVRPFILDRENHDMSNQTVTSNDVSVTFEDGWSASLEYPFAIASCLTFIVALMFLTFFRKSRKDSAWRADDYDLHRNQFTFDKNWYKPKSWTEGDFPLACIMLTFLFTFCPLPIGAERVIGKFLFAYAREVTSFEIGEGTLLETCFWASFTAGRGISLVFSRCIHSSSILTWCLGSCIICCAILVAYASRFKTILWIFSCLFAMTLSPIFPAWLNWANSKMKINVLTTSLTFVASAGGSMVLPWIAGYIYAYKSKKGLMSLLLYCSIIAAFVAAVGMLSAQYRLARLRKARKARLQKAEVTDNIRIDNAEENASDIWNDIERDISRSLDETNRQLNMLPTEEKNTS